jgi:hypothetical protein
MTSSTCRCIYTKTRKAAGFKESSAEYFALEGSAYTKKRLGQMQQRGKYGRLLAHVWLAN